MYRWHHRTGVVAYLVLLAHPLLLAADGFAEAPALAWQTLAPVDESWPVWSGWLALILLMAGLTITFMRRLPYRAWRWLHAGLGVAVLFCLLHLILLGIGEPVLPILAAAMLILAWRGIRDELGLAAWPYIVQSVHRVAAGTIEISLRPLATSLTAMPGQFVLVAFSTGANYRGCGEFHPFSISFIDQGDVLHIGVKALGDCTRQMQSIQPGVPARVQGAFGSFLAGPPSASQLWIAGGIGVTPFIALLRAGGVTSPTLLLYLYRTEAEAAFLAELRALAAATPLLTLQTVETGQLLPDLERLLPDAHCLGCRECYLCGPPELTAALKPALRKRGIAVRRIHFENFDFR